MNKCCSTSFISLRIRYLTGESLTENQTEIPPTKLWQIPVVDINQKQSYFGEFRSAKKTTFLILNIATKCRLSKSNFKALNNLYSQFSEKGLEVIGFPCNQFWQQCPGSSEAIKSTCQAQYNVKFPIMAPCDVNGANAHPIFQYLRANTKQFQLKRPGHYKQVPWNFSKWIVDSNGKVLMYIDPSKDLTAYTDFIIDVLKKGEKDDGTPINNQLSHK